MGKGGRSRLAALLLLGLALPVLGRGDPADGTDARDWVGVWQLDRDASDPVGPLLERMEAPGMARWVADRMTPQLTIEAIYGPGLRMLNENPIQTTRQDWIPDGVDREREDALGRRVVSRASWDERGRLVITQRNHLDADRVLEVVSTWVRIAERLELWIRVDSDDEPLRIRRVFRRKTRSSRR